MEVRRSETDVLLLSHPSSRESDLIVPIEAGRQIQAGFQKLVEPVNLLSKRLYTV